MPEVALQEYLQEINLLIEESHQGEAIGQCRNILRQFPRHVETYRLLGKALLEQGDLVAASDVFQRVLSADPEDFVAHAGLAIIHKEDGRLTDAVWHMQRGFEVEPYNGAIRETLQDLIGRRDGLPPENVTLTRGALARLYVRGELYAHAVSDLRQLLEEEPDRMDLHILLAEALWRDGQRIDAADECARILERLPYCIKANAILAEVWLVTDRVEEAQAYLRRVFEMVLPTATSLRQDSPVAIVFRTDGSPTLPDRIMVERTAPGVGAGGLEDATDWVQDIDFGEELALEDVEPDWLGGMEQGSDLMDTEIETSEREEVEGESLTQMEDEERGEDRDEATSWFSRPSDQLPGIGELSQETDWEAWLENGPELAGSGEPGSQDASSDIEIEEAGMTGMDEHNHQEDEFPEMDEPQPSDMRGSDEGEKDLDWLDELQEASQPSMEGEAGDEDDSGLPDWLHAGVDDENLEETDLDWLDEMEEGGESEVEERAPKGEDLPDWLRDEMMAESDDTEAAIEEDLSWLDQIAAGEGPSLEEPPTMSWPESEPHEDEDAEQYAASDTADEAPSDRAMAPPPEDSPKALAGEAGELDEDAPIDDVPEDLDEAMAWLEQLAAQQGAPAEELPSLPTTPESDQDTVPEDIESAMDWLDELVQAPDEEAFERLAISEEAAPEPEAIEEDDFETIQASAQPEAMDVDSDELELEIEAGIGRTESHDEVPETSEMDEAMAWLEELAAEGAPQDAVTGLGDLEDQLDSEALAELDDVPDDPEQALAWLESLASEAALEQGDEPGAGVVEEDRTPPVPFDVASARAEAESILLHDDSIAEDTDQEAEMLEAIPDDPDEAMAWLEKLAARQGASLDELPSLTEVDEDVQAPDWLTQELASASEAEDVDVIDVDPESSTDDTGDFEDVAAEDAANVPVMKEEWDEAEVDALDELEAFAEEGDIEDESILDEMLGDMAPEEALPDWLAIGEEGDIGEFDWDEEPFDPTGWLASEEDASQDDAAEDAFAPDVAAAAEDAAADPAVYEEAEALDTAPVQPEDEVEPLEVEDVIEESLDELPEGADEADVLPEPEQEPVISDAEEALQLFQDRLASEEDLPALIEDLERAAQTREVQPRILQLLGDAYNKNGQLQKALDAYRRALEML